MKTLTAFLLVGLLALWTELPSATGYRNPLAIPWICPKNPFSCSLPGISTCRYDYDCPQNQRCCGSSCGRVCRIPQVIPRPRPRPCPQIPFRCTVPGIDRCRIDSDCPGRQRCCYYNCSRVCRF
ncbi:waprin-Enh1-like [Tiliqua scincoides]|uniref:waprin-Enh1-like n=1 Tax=Tiliqua scincoides TaxID=71010 RepID=UPI003462AA5A